MAAIRGKDTRPEWIVRRLVFALGHRYRLHSKQVIGKPDLIFARQKKVILVHGCFWHMHRCRFGRVVPKTNAAFWAKKRTDNVKRDRLVKAQLIRSGWKVFEVWECQTKQVAALRTKLERFLSGG